MTKTELDRFKDSCEQMLDKVNAYHKDVIDKGHFSKLINMSSNLQNLIRSVELLSNKFTEIEKKKNEHKG